MSRRDDEGWRGELQEPQAVLPPPHSAHSSLAGWLSAGSCRWNLHQDLIELAVLDGLEGGDMDLIVVNGRGSPSISSSKERASWKADLSD